MNISMQLMIVVFWNNIINVVVVLIVVAVNSLHILLLIINVCWLINHKIANVHHIIRWQWDYVHACNHSNIRLGLGLELGLGLGSSSYYEILSMSVIIIIIIIFSFVIRQKNVEKLIRSRCLLYYIIYCYDLNYKEIRIIKSNIITLFLFKFKI